MIRKAQTTPPPRFCECGCDLPVKMRNRFVNGHNSKGIKTSNETKQILSAQKLGKNNPNWKGGIRKHIKGYIHQLRPDHPFTTKDGYIQQARLVLEEYLGRYLDPEEEPHHCNRKKDDNRIENLELTLHGKHIEEYHNKHSEDTKQKMREAAKIVWEKRRLL